MKFAKKLVAIMLCFSANCMISQISFGLEKYDEEVCSAERINSFKSLNAKVHSGETDFIKDTHMICGKEYTTIVSALKEEPLQKIIEFLTPSMTLSDFEKMYEKNKQEKKQRNIKLKKISLLVALITGALTYGISLFKVNTANTVKKCDDKNINKNKENTLKVSKFKNFLFSLFRGVCVGGALYILSYAFFYTCLTKPTTIDYEKLICEYNNKLSTVKTLLHNIIFTKGVDEDVLCLRVVDFDKPDFLNNICGFERSGINYTEVEANKIENNIKSFTTQLQNIITTYREIE